MAAIKVAEGRTISQDRDSRVILGMPRVTIEVGVVVAQRQVL